MRTEEPARKNDAAPTYRNRLVALLCGGAIGDALGLPAEGLSRKRVARLWHGNLRHRFIFGHGMCSDDTEHAFLTAQCLLLHRENAESFQRSLGWKLRWWFIALPAGVGLGTARAIIRLWFGVPPSRSGVNSAGNGPAMRAPIIGAFFYNDPERRRVYTIASATITHTDQRAITAALAISEAAAWACLSDINSDVQPLVAKMPALAPTDAEWCKVCATIELAVRNTWSHCCPVRND
jgi:ADP-ribosylglycohydrolase